MTCQKSTIFGQLYDVRSHRVRLVAHDQPNIRARRTPRCPVSDLTYQALLEPTAAGLAVGACSYPIVRFARLDRPFPGITSALRWLPLVLAAAYGVIFGWFGVVKLQAMHGRFADVALIDQMVWSTLQGQFEHTTIQGIGVSNFLAFHVEPILALLSPLDLLFHDSRVLVVIQAVALGITAIPIGLWARRRLKSPIAAAVIPLAFLISPVVAQDSDRLFAEIPLAVPCLAFALYFQLRHNWKFFWLSLVLAMAVREEIAFVVIGMGLFAVIFQGEQRQGLATRRRGFSLGNRLPRHCHSLGRPGAGYLLDPVSVRVPWRRHARQYFLWRANPSAARSAAHGTAGEAAIRPLSPGAARIPPSAWGARRLVGSPDAGLSLPGRFPHVLRPNLLVRLACAAVPVLRRH